MKGLGVSNITQKYSQMVYIHFINATTTIISRGESTEPIQKLTKTAKDAGRINKTL